MNSNIRKQRRIIQPFKLGLLELYLQEHMYPFEDQIWCLFQAPMFQIEGGEEP